MRNVHFIGSSVTGLEALYNSPDFKLVSALCLEQRLTDSLVDACGQRQIPLTLFRNPRDLRNIIVRYPAETLFFIYQLDMLVPKDIAESYTFFNVHRGSLKDNRGPTPDIWPILEGHERSWLSLHRIDGRVDAGLLIKEIAVDLLPDDDPHSVRHRMEAHLPEMIAAMSRYLDGEIEAWPVGKEGYRPWISEADITISEKDSFVSAERKVRCQKPYNGAVLFFNGVRYYVRHIERLEEVNVEKIKEDQDCQVIKLMDGFARVVFNLNPTFPPLKVRPKSKRI